MTATWNGWPSSSNVLRAISAGKWVPSIRRPVDSERDGPISELGRRLVLVQRHEVAELGPDEPLDRAAEQLAAWRVAQDAALLVEGEDRVRIGLEEGPEAGLAGACDAGLLGLATGLAEADEHLLAIDRVGGERGEVGEECKVVADEQRPAFDIGDHVLRDVLARPHAELDGRDHRLPASQGPTPLRHLPTMARGCPRDARQDRDALRSEDLAGRSGEVGPEGPGVSSVGGATSCAPAGTRPRD